LADLTVPEAQRPILNRIRTMSEDSVRALVSAFELSPDGGSSEQGLSSKETEAIREVVLELYRVREFFGMEAPEFASEIAQAVQEVQPFPADELPSFRDRLTRLLTIESVNIAVKAASLKLEYERRFCTARILTDARPVYAVDPSRPPSAAMIMHTLRISYHDDTSELREVYIAMDRDDMTTLRDLLDRAEEKASSLESLLAEAGVRIVAP